MRVRARHSLLVRLGAGAVLVAVASTAATAWLVARSTTVAIEQQQGEALSDDTRIYSVLLDYAATHPDWTAVGPVVAALAESTGRDITLTTERREPITGGPGPLARNASSVVDPLAVDPALVADSPANRIDRAVVGPYRLTPGESTRLAALARRDLACVRAQTGAGSIATSPGGRPRIVGVDLDVVATCPAAADATREQGPVRGRLDRPTATERAALGELTRLTNTCLATRGAGRVEVSLGFTWRARSSHTPPARRAVETCLATSRRSQLEPYVAPPALLFLGSPSSATATVDPLTDVRRVAGVAGIVLLATLAIALVGAHQLVRPVRALTGAARRLAAGDETARVPERRRADEVGELTAAFNDMADSRARAESLRRAMVSDIAHELRTPLSNIRGWLEAVEDGLAEPDAELLASLGEEAALLQSIIDDLRDLATADAGRLVIHPEQLHLATLFEQSLDAFGYQATATGVRLEALVDDELELEADPVRLRQVLANLLGNALRHTDRGGSITLTGRAEGDWVVLEVTDTGTGIQVADLPHVFDRFWRADPSRSRHHGGSGLGLAIVRSLVEAHGGTVGVASTVGAGTTFTLRLPRRGPGPAS
ncbi:sensor histidine kinase [Nocardioides plantarum]|uniref:histidine kinase n=1 Tax=Nocardioides plantarum TaxID=29299 RepID=A0ABV5KFD8_9ACTN|nr:HAMP domain-containing sensor histidine kinase [Nocardioides plantarum]